MTVRSTIIGTMLLVVSGCDLGRDYENDPIVCLRLCERRGSLRLETVIHRDGKVFRGYYQEPDAFYGKTAESQLPPETNRRLWEAVDGGEFPEKFPWSEPDGDFKGIGATWQGRGGTYGVSCGYSSLIDNSPLSKALAVLQENAIDKWEVPGCDEPNTPSEPKVK